MLSICRTRGIALTVAAGVLAIPIAAQHRDTNPFSSREDFHEGLLLYRTNCGVCHGMEGKSGRGARLAVREHRHGNSDAELFRIIQNGIPGTEMPGLWLDEDSIWKILLVVRSFEVDAGDACKSEPGDPEKGEQLYASTGCRACHIVENEGGRLGPEMTHVGLNYSREQLLTALVDPAKDVGRMYQPVRVTVDGKTVEGVLRNEDAYSVQMMDRSDRLRSFLKEEIDSLSKPGGSLMPPYGQLDAYERDDLLAYLCSLKGPAGEEEE